MKKLSSILVVVLVCCLLLSTTAFAATKKSTTEYVTTSAQEFADYMDGEGYKYTYEGTNKDGDEDHFRIKFNGDEMDTIAIDIYFDSDNNGACFYVWNVVDAANSKQMTSLMQVCNELNYDYRFVKFYTDDTDNSVTAQADAIFRAGCVGEVCDETIYYIVNIVDLAYVELAAVVG